MTSSGAPFFHLSRVQQRHSAGLVKRSPNHKEWLIWHSIKFKKAMSIRNSNICDTPIDQNNVRAPRNEEVKSADIKVVRVGYAGTQNPVKIHLCQ